ncbi:hypothetical protein BWI97_14310 [Siphonobacter sp. BAB-5405]|nr:hypothetical protein BWI97_14310 [Siphonobacter sp. BAB-5405]
MQDTQSTKPGFNFPMLAAIVLLVLIAAAAAAIVVRRRSQQVIKRGKANHQAEVNSLNARLTQSQYEHAALLSITETPTVNEESQPA